MAANNQPAIVIVDDEEMVIISLRAYFALETDFTVHGFTRPEQAVEFLKTNSVDVVVSDYLMPKMNGIQLLARARELRPEAARVLLTGHADKQSAIQAINEVGLFHYLEKPWDNAALLLVVRNGIERARLLRELRETVSQLDSAQSSLRDVQMRLLKAFL